MIPLTWLAMVAIEWAYPARDWPEIRFWRTRGAAFFVLYMMLNALLPGWLPAAFGAHALLPIAGWPVLAQVIVAYAVLSLTNALLHRSYHRYDLLWRWVHQLHHAPQRLDSGGAVVMTPLEMVGYIAIFQLVVVLGFGLDPLAGAIVGYLSTFYSLFQHVNVRTPQWLGVFIQRPESHGVHHRRGVHGYNYSDLPLWDILMGTFRNPRRFNGDVGFEGDAAPHVLPLLRGRDLNAQAYGRGSRGTQAPNRNPA
jgi:sterol desaturase/sphingolipid hydroxylase (fatty acid hydroxylase superfamily)